MSGQGVLTFPPEAGSEHTWQGASLVTQQEQMSGMRADLEARSPLYLSEANWDLQSYFTLFASLFCAAVDLEDWRPCTHTLTHRHVALLVFCPRVASVR